LKFGTAIIGVWFKQSFQLIWFSKFGTCSKHATSKSHQRMILNSLVSSTNETPFFLQSLFAWFSFLLCANHYFNWQNLLFQYLKCFLSLVAMNWLSSICFKRNAFTKWYAFSNKDLCYPYANIIYAFVVLS
jgi:hypothetical protein